MSSRLQLCASWATKTQLQKTQTVGELSAWKSLDVAPEIYFNVREVPSGQGEVCALNWVHLGFPTWGAQPNRALSQCSLRQAWGLSVPRCSAQPTEGKAPVALRNWPLRAPCRHSGNAISTMRGVYPIHPSTFFSYACRTCQRLASGFLQTSPDLVLSGTE